MVESVDDNIQRILDYLNENKLRENTMIVFTSDNGYHGGQSNNKLMRGAKGYIYEGGIRVPMIVNWPGKVTPRRSTMAVTCLDVFPTLMDVTGIKTFSGVLDGDSVKEMFHQDTDLFKDRPLFWHIASQYKHGACSVIRKGNYKLIEFLASGKLELYNLFEDQKESHNLADSEPEKLLLLHNELINWRKLNHVPLPPNSPLEF